MKSAIIPSDPPAQKRSPANGVLFSGIKPRLHRVKKCQLSACALAVFLALAAGSGWECDAATMGCTNAGNSSETVDDSVQGNVFTAPANFIGTTMHIFVSGAASGNMFMVGIYNVNQSTNQPTSLLRACSSSPPPYFTVGQWNAAPLTSPVGLWAGTKYYLGLQFNSDADIGLNTTISGTRWSVAAGGPNFPNPFGTPTPGPDNTLAIYVSGPLMTSTATASPTASTTPTFTPTPSITPTATDTQTITGTTTTTRTVTSTPTITVTVTATMTPYQLAQNQVAAYPQPAHGRMLWFYYYAPEGAEATIDIFNVLGEKGETVTAIHAAAGYQRVGWDLQQVAPGLYFYHLRLHSAAGTRDYGIKKVVVVK
ncbi:hypothetical protein JW933_02330 [candidate division FCPU426 bacterium]|nr:hypothetical protein [candidate division FCPU426 bacterium]